MPNNLSLFRRTLSKNKKSGPAGHPKRDTSLRIIKENPNVAIDRKYPVSKKAVDRRFRGVKRSCRAGLFCHISHSALEARRSIHPWPVVIALFDGACHTDAAADKFRSGLAGHI